MLSDSEILALGPKLVEPFHPEMVQPASLEVRLDNKFFFEDDTCDEWINPKQNNDHLLRPIDISRGSAFSLNPKGFALASTIEKITLPKTVASRFEGKSSLGRIGLFTHITAGFIDPGFSGHITLELFNATDRPMILYPGMKIGQMCFFYMNKMPVNPYGSGKAGSHYQGQSGPTRSRIHENFYQFEGY